MSLLPKDLEEMLGTKEQFEEAQKKRDEDRKDFEECRDEDILRDNLPEVDCDAEIGDDGFEI